MVDLRSGMMKMMSGRRRAVNLLSLLLVLLFAARTTESFSVRYQTYSRARRSQLAVVAEKRSTQIDQTKKEDVFFIRHCLPAEIGQASDILTNVFFKENTNLFTYQWERLTTYLSLDGTYPRPGERHALFVACHVNSGMVLGLAEIDDRPSKDRNATPRPYMFNVAVDPRFRRKGIAKALVLACEDAARVWGKDEVFLKVRDTSTPAINMYEQLGYVKRSAKVEKLNKKYQNLVVMSKDLDIDLGSDKE